jgi:hypothetical protein
MTMKTKFACYHLIPVLAAGLMISPLAAQSPDGPAGPPRGDNPREAPQPDRIQAAMRQMREFHQAGKHEEARAISQRLRQAAKDNPQVAKQITEAIRNQRQQSATETPGAPPQRQMMRPHAQGGPQGRMMGPKGPPIPQRPIAQPNAPACENCPMMRPNAPRPNAPGAQPSQVVRPKVEAARQANAGKGEIAKIRHLRQAAEHLAAAGYAEHAAKAREEIGRMAAALKASKPQPPTGKPQSGDSLAPKMMRDKPKPAPDGKPDATMTILGELKKIGKQVGDLSARVRKLETQGNPARD